MAAKVQMVPESRFGLMMGAAVQSQGISLRTLAVKLDYSYEQMRKIWQGESSPGDTVLGMLCSVLNLDPVAAKQAVVVDRIQREHGVSVFSVLGKDPRIADIEPLLPQLSKPEWDMFVTQIRAVVQQKMKRKG